MYVPRSYVSYRIGLPALTLRAGRSVQLLAELEELFPEVRTIIGDLACDLLFAESGLAKQRRGGGETEEVGKQGRVLARLGE
jgi:hypothetical protein